MAVTHLVWRRAALLAVAALIVIPALGAAGTLSEAERRGKRIYFEGQGRGPISAHLLGPRITAPGSSFPCANCHLGAGPGVKEGGVQTSDIAYSTLTKEFHGVRPSGRAHAPYTDAGLERAVTFGTDPDGNALHEVHPRYTMGSEDLADLVAYLKLLGREPVPGVSDAEVRVGVLLPDRGPLGEAATVVQGLLQGYVAELNAQGGLFRRTIRLVPLLFDPTRSESLTAVVRDLVEKEEVFCLVANLGVPPEDGSLALLSSARIPVIAPMQVALESGYGSDRYTFHVYASVHDQARVMADFLTQDEGNARTRVAVVHATDRAGEAGAAGAREQLSKHGRSLVADVGFAPGQLPAPQTVSRVKDASADAVLFFGASADALEFLAEAHRQQWRPRVVAPAAMVGPSVLSLPPDVARHLYLASPITSLDPPSETMAPFIRLAEKSGTPFGRHGSFQILAYAGARLLEEGLRRSGREVTRARLVEVLGSLRAFSTGVTSPLTYGENRRVGAPGARVLAIDPERGRLTVAAPWREPR